MGETDLIAINFRPIQFCTFAMEVTGVSARV